MSYLKKQKNVKKVLIHDAARPNFSNNLIKKILIQSRKNKVVIPILKLQDALKEIGFIDMVNYIRQKFKNND